MRILLRYETSDAELALALEQNQFVMDICFDLMDAQTSNWVALLRVIATRANLNFVTLTDEESFNERNADVAVPLVSAFLLSIQQNHSIGVVTLALMCLPIDVSTFVDNTSSVTTLTLSNCDFAPTEREVGTRDLSAALQRNTNIENLELDFMGDISAILLGLRSNACLKSIEIGGAFHNGGAMQQLLEATTSIQ